MMIQHIDYPYRSIHTSHISWSFGFGAPHIMHTSLLRSSYLHTMFVMVDGIGDKSHNPSYHLSIHHFSFASKISYFETRSCLTSSLLSSLHISNINPCQPIGSVSNSVSCSSLMSSHGYFAIISRFLSRPI